MRYGIIATGLLMATACSDTQSEDVFTSGMYASLSVTASGDGQATAQAVLKVGGATSTNFVYLTADDELLASYGETEPVPMEEIELLEYHGYAVALDDDSPETEFEIAFVRTLDEGAPSSTMQLPEPFELTAPPTSSSRAADLVLAWSVSGSASSVAIGAEGDCIQLYSQSVQGDPGTFTIPADAFETGEGNEAATCPITLTVRKYRVGSVDPAFEEGGIANGIQLRTAEIQSTP